MNLFDLVSRRPRHKETCGCPVCKVFRGILEAADAERREEVARLDLAWWYLSFARGGRWLGGIAVRAFGPLDALREATLRGEALEGEIKYVRLPADPPPSAINRLLSEHEVRVYLGEALAVRP